MVSHAAIGVMLLDYRLMWCSSRLHYLRCNKKKAPLREEHPELVTDPSIAFADLTDRVNPIFQYTY